MKLFLPAAAAASSVASSLLIAASSNNYPSVVTAFVAPLSSSSIRLSSARFFSAVASSPQDAQQQQQLSPSSSYAAAAADDDEYGGVLTGQVMSILRSSYDGSETNNGTGGGGAAAFAVVKVCEEDLLPNSAYAVAKAMATAAATKDENDCVVVVTNKSGGEEEVEEEEGDKVELASALFGKPMPAAVKKSTAAANKNKNGGVVGACVVSDVCVFCAACFVYLQCFVLCLNPPINQFECTTTCMIDMCQNCFLSLFLQQTLTLSLYLSISINLPADGDFTGRTVSFTNSNQKGMVVAHRHPVVFVLLEEDENTITSRRSDDDNGIDKGSICSISHKRVSIDPLAIPNGSIVDYLGNSLAVLKDGSVSRSLPKAAADGGGVDLESGLRIGGVISLTVSTTSEEDDDDSSSGNTRPIFMPIPKISDIGLIDSPLVSGITAIDALTPIGKGQNMLVIGDADEEATNKRGWMINFLRNVIENNRHETKSKTMRCFYGLTSGSSNVRSNLLDRLKEAGIQDDIVTILSTRNHSEEGEGGNASSAAISTEKAMTAAEAVAVAATTCSLAEHHALTTGGDSIVFIDDINLHKSLWDVTTQFLVQVYGVDAVVAADLQGSGSSEMRGYFSGLIQRSARFKLNKGGGSVTLILLSTLPGDEVQVDNNGEDEPTFEVSDFENMPEKIKTRISMLVKAKVPLTPTNLKKIKLPLPSTSDAENTKRLALQHVEDLISMSDGQIWLDDALAKSGRSPPLDPSRSITRVGVGADTVSCRADAPALRSVVGSLRFEFQQAMDVMDTSTASAIVGNKKQVQRRDAFLLAMHQESNQRRKLSHECIALLAASRGHLDTVLAEGGLAGTVQGKEAINGLIEFVENNASGVVTEIESTLDLSSEGKSVLEDTITTYFAKGN